MASKLSSVLIGFGCLLMLLGLVMLASGLSQGSDESIKGAGICGFSFGALVTAAGIYGKAKAVQASGSVAVALAKPQPTKKQPGGCDLCGTETPAIMCRAHQLHMCATCLTRHFDARSCVYMPSSRRPASKAAWA